MHLVDRFARPLEFVPRIMTMIDGRVLLGPLSVFLDYNNYTQSFLERVGLFDGTRGKRDAHVRGWTITHFVMYWQWCR